MTDDRYQFLVKRLEAMSAEVEFLEQKADYYLAALKRIAQEVAQSDNARQHFTQIEVLLRRIAETKELLEVLES